MAPGQLTALVRSLLVENVKKRNFSSWQDVFNEFRLFLKMQRREQDRNLIAEKKR